MLPPELQPQSNKTEFTPEKWEFLYSPKAKTNNSFSFCELWIIGLLSDHLMFPLNFSLRSLFVQVTIVLIGSKFQNKALFK